MAVPEVCVVYLLRTNPVVEVLIGEKLTGLGKGKLVAPGGKLEPGEMPPEAAVREVFEEVGVVVRARDLTLVGELTYLFPFKPEWTQKSSAFVVHEWLHEPLASNELDPAWYPISRLPLERMWSDAKLWLPDALQGETVIAEVEFAEDNASVVRFDRS